MDTGWVVIGKGVELLVKGGYHLGHRTNTVRASFSWQGDGCPTSSREEVHTHLRV